MIRLVISNFALVAMALRFAEPGRAPLIRTHGWIVKAVPGEKVYMPCEASGDPDPSINWERDGMPVSLFGNRFSVNAGTQALRVFNVKVDDRGNYTCIAKNPFGVDLMSVVLLVMIQPECKIISPTNVTFSELTNQELVCRSRGLPKPSFEWLTNRHQRIRPMKYVFDNMTTSKRLYSVERQIDEEMFESVLFLQPVTFKDLGSFVCVSFNEIGRSRDSVSLDVQFSPKVLSSHQLPLHVPWWAGHATNLTCTATGNHLPEIVWARGGQHFHCTNLEEWVRGSEITSSCTITERVSGGPGNYTCSAENGLGKTLVHIFIVKEMFPAPGVEVRATSSSSDEVLLSVTVPPKPDSPQATHVLVSYRLYAESGEESPQHQLTADVDDRGEATVRLLGIRNGSDYQVTVTATNVVGFGPETTIIVNTGRSIQPHNCLAVCDSWASLHSVLCHCFLDDRHTYHWKPTPRGLLPNRPQLCVDRDVPFDTASLIPPTKKPTGESQAQEDRHPVQLAFSTTISPNQKHIPNNTQDHQADILEPPSNNSVHIALKVTATHSRAMGVHSGQKSCLIPCSCLLCLLIMFSRLLFHV